MYTYKEFEEDFKFYLENPNKINRISFLETTFKKNIELLLPQLEDTEDFIEVYEVLAYLCGKAAEMAILEVCRPDFVRIWVSKNELKGNIVMNLPMHLSSLVIEMMSGCENAVEKFILNNKYDLNKLALDVSFISEMIVRKYKLYDMHVEGYSNKEIAFPSEIYNYANSIVLKELEMSGYKVLGYEPNFNSPVNMVLEKDGIKYVVLENITVDPIKGKFLPYLRNACISVARKDNAEPCCLGVMISSKNEDAKSKGVVPLKGECRIRRTELFKI